MSDLNVAPQLNNLFAIRIILDLIQSLSSLCLWIVCVCMCNRAKILLTVPFAHRLLCSSLWMQFYMKITVWYMSTHTTYTHTHTHNQTIRQCHRVMGERRDTRRRGQYVMHRIDCILKRFTRWFPSSLSLYRL